MPDTVQKVCEHPALIRAAFGMYVANNADLSIAAKLAQLRNVTDRFQQQALQPSTPLAIPGAVAELFGYRLSQFTDVNVPQVLLTMEQPDEETCGCYYVKKQPGGFVLSERVPESMPLYFLRGKAETLPGAINEAVFRRTFLELFDKRCPLSREAYADFPDELPAQAKEAARWNGRERLLQYAFCGFLHRTYPHSSNALVDVHGKLWLIDFEKTYMPEDDDIARLHDLVKESAEVMQICGHISRITPQEIEESFTDIPQSFWKMEGSVRLKYGAHDTPEAAAAYFVERLERWQSYFQAEEKAKHASQ